MFKDKEGVKFGVKLQCISYAMEIACVGKVPPKDNASTEKIIEEAEKIYEWIKE